MAARVDELMRTDEEIKELSKSKGRFAAYDRACEKVEQEFAAAASK